MQTNVIIKPWTAPSRQRKDKSFPVCLEIKKQRLSLDLFCLKSEWTNGQFNKTYKNYRDQNKLIAAYKKKAEDIIKEMGINYEWKRFKRKFQDKEPSGKYLEYHNLKLKELYDQNRIGSATVDKNRNTTIEKFLRSKKRKPELFEINEITIPWLKEYESFLRQSCGDTSIGMYMRSLRALINKAIADQVADSYPFGKGKYSIGKNTVKVKRSIAINKDQIKKIESLDHFHIDLFLFSYYCRGINLKDICYLKKNNIEDGKLIYFRQKTIRKKAPKPIVIQLLPKALQIVEKQVSELYLFPIFNKLHKTEQQKDTRKRTINRDINKTLKRLVLPLLNIEKLTFYSARHSYAMAMRSAGINLSVISQALGHESEQTTKNYLAQFSNDVIDQADRAALL